MHYMITQPPPGEAILISIFDILDKRDWRETRERNTLDDRGVLGDSRGRHLLYTVVDSDADVEDIDRMRMEDCVIGAGV